MTSTRTRLVAATGALAITMLAAAPAGAATVLSRADANAATISLAGNGQGTGTASATYDGDTETRTGETAPPVSLLSGQSFLSAGVLTQQATAGDGFSAACAGFAGTSGSVAQIGDGSCLTRGNAVEAGLGTVRLSDLKLTAPGSALDPASPLFELLGDNVLSQVTAAVDTALDQAEAQAGDYGLVARLGTIEGRCRVEGGAPTGSATLADTGLRLRIPGRDDVVLADLPVDPAPDTRVFTDLGDVLDLVLGAVQSDLATSLDGALAPLGQAAVGPVREQIVAAVKQQVQSQLAPLEKDVLRVTLNEQSKPTADSIKVTALHVEVVPAATAAVGVPAADVRIGNADCGPAGSAPVVQAPQAAPPKDLPAIPTAVSAGMESAPQTQQVTWTSMAPLGVTALVGLVVAGLGLAGLRRHLS